MNKIEAGFIGAMLMAIFATGLNLATYKKPELQRVNGKPRVLACYADGDVWLPREAGDTFTCYMADRPKP